MNPGHFLYGGGALFTLVMAASALYQGKLLLMGVMLATTALFILPLKAVCE